MERAAVQHESLAANTAANFLLLQEQKGTNGQDTRQPSAAAVFIPTFTSPGGGNPQESSLPESPGWTKQHLSISNSTKQKMNENFPPLVITKSYFKPRRAAIAL